MKKTAIKFEFPADNAAAMHKVLAEAAAHIGECDNIVVLMQKKTDGLHWFAPDEMRFETLIFIVTSFLHGIMGNKQ